MIILRDENSNFIASITLILNNIVIKSHLPMIREETFVFDISDVNNVCLINPEISPEIHRLEEYHTEEEVKESSESIHTEEVKEFISEEPKTKRKSKRGKKV